MCCVTPVRFNIIILCKLKHGIHSSDELAGVGHELRVGTAALPNVTDIF